MAVVKVAPPVGMIRAAYVGMELPPPSRRIPGSLIGIAPPVRMVPAANIGMELPPPLRRVPHPLIRIAPPCRIMRGNPSRLIRPPPRGIMPGMALIVVAPRRRRLSVTKLRTGRRGQKNENYRNDQKKRLDPAHISAPGNGARLQGPIHHVRLRNAIIFSRAPRKGDLDATLIVPRPLLCGRGRVARGLRFFFA